VPKIAAEHAKRVRRAQLVVAALQLLPGAMLLAIGSVGAVLYSPIALVVPLGVFGLCLWQLRSAWWRPFRWAVGGAYAGVPAGLSTGFALGLFGSAEMGWSPRTALLPAFLGAALLPLFVLGAAHWLRSYALRAEPAELAASRLELPFRLVCTAAVLLVGQDTLTLHRTSGNSYRSSLVNRTVRNSVPLARVHVHEVKTLDAPTEIELPGMHYPARARAGTQVVVLQADRANWVLPIRDAEPLVEVIRLRRRRLQHDPER
jgi:hypothetical protein